MKRAYPVLYMVKDDKDMVLPIPPNKFHQSPMDSLKPLIYDYMPDAYLFCGQVEIRSYKFTKPDEISKPKKVDAVMLLGRTMKGEKFRELYQMQIKNNDIIFKKDKNKKILKKAKSSKEP
jgi:hypothetical protein